MEVLQAISKRVHYGEFSFCLFLFCSVYDSVIGPRSGICGVIVWHPNRYVLKITTPLFHLPFPASDLLIS